MTDLVDARWRLHRLITMETAALDEAITQQTAANETTRAARAFSELADTSRGLALLHRHEGRMRRAIARALTRLDTVRAKNKKHENELDLPAANPPAAEAL